MSISGINSKVAYYQKNDPIQVLSSTINKLLNTGKVKKTDIQDAIFCCDTLKTFPASQKDEITMRMVLLATSQLNIKYKHLLSK